MTAGTEAPARPRRRALRWVLIGLVGVLVVVLVGGGIFLLVAWRSGWLDETYLAATRGCGERTWTDDRPPAVAAAPVELEPRITTLIGPTDMAFHPDLDGAFATTQAGELHWVDPSTGDAELVLDLSADISTEDDRGLLGVAVAPDGTHLYVNYTNAEGDSRLSAFDIDAGRPVAGSERVIIAVDQESSSHNGGGLLFGPDGMLYTTFGDGGLVGDRNGHAQRADTILGSIIRIDPTPDADEPYDVPADNPFVGLEDARPEVYVLGVRHPYRFAFDPTNGGLWIADVGHNCLEEVTFVAAGGGGANLGWNRFEGTRSFVGGDPERYDQPTFEYPRQDGWCAIIGGRVIASPALPSYAGDYAFGDFCRGSIVAVDTEADPFSAQVIADGVGAVIGFAEGDDGRLYVLTFADGILELVEPG